MGIIKNDLTDCYVGIKPCGCMVAWVRDEQGYENATAKVVIDFIKSGYRVERAISDEVRLKLCRCKCAKKSPPVLSSGPDDFGKDG